MTIINSAEKGLSSHLSCALKLIETLAPLRPRGKIDEEVVLCGTTSTWACSGCEPEKKSPVERRFDNRTCPVGSARARPHDVHEIDVGQDSGGHHHQGSRAGAGSDRSS